MADIACPTCGAAHIRVTGDPERGITVRIMPGAFTDGPHAVPVLAESMLRGHLRVMLTTVPLAQAAAITGMKASALRKRVDNGTLRGYRVGRRLRVERRELGSLIH